MKRIFLTILLVAICLSAFVGCSNDELSAPITVEYYVVGETSQIMLDYENDLIMELLNSNKWITNDTAKVSNDYKLTINNKEILYCSETGTFTDEENQRYIVANEADRIAINNSLQQSLNAK